MTAGGNSDIKILGVKECNAGKREVGWRVSTGGSGVSVSVFSTVYTGVTCLVLRGNHGD